MNAQRLCRYIAISLIAAGPVGGFLFGLLNPGDPDPNPIGRLVYSCIMAVVTPLHGGFPPHHEAGAGQTFNAWPHMVVSFLLILVWFVRRDWKLAKKRNTPAS